MGTVAATDRSVLGSLQTLEWVYQTAPVGLCVLDRQLRYVRINDFLARMNGRPAAAHLGRTVREILPKAADVVEDIAARIFEHGMPELVTEGAGFDHERPDRPGVWRAAWYPIKSPEGDIVGLSVVVEDITERRQAEEALRHALDSLEQHVAERTAALAESELKFRRLAEGTRDILYTIDCEGRFQYIGPPLGQYGYTPEDLIGRLFLEFIHPEDVALVQANFLASLQAETSLPVIFRVNTPKQGTRWFEERGSSNRDANGNVIGFTGIIRDITETRLAADTLRESEEKYRKLFETETDLIVLLDAQTGRALDANEAALRAYGYTREEFLILPPEGYSAEPEASLALLNRVLEKGRAHARLRWHRRKDGTLIPLEVHAARYSWRGRDIICGVARDISDQLAREDENRRQREALSRLARAVTAAAERERQRIATDLHDNLAQLLVSCQVRIDQLLQQARPRQLKPTLQRVWDILDRAVKDTRDLTFRLAPPALEEAGLAAALDQMCRDLRDEYGLPFLFQEGGAGPPLELSLRQVVFRCVREAAVNAGRHAGARHVTVELTHEPDHLRVEVADDGRGFDARTAGFDFSAEGGYGLFSARQQLLHAGASLAIHSMPGKGTRVIIELPLDAAGKAT
jgi:PAS domain S-box-containing protein